MAHDAFVLAHLARSLQWELLEQAFKQSGVVRKKQRNAGSTRLIVAAQSVNNRDSAGHTDDAAKKVAAIKYRR